MDKRMFRWMSKIARKKGFDYCFNDYSDWEEINDPEFQKLKYQYIRSAQLLEKYMREQSGEINTKTFTLTFYLNNEYGPIYKELPLSEKDNLEIHVKDMINDYLEERWDQELDRSISNSDLLTEITEELLEKDYFFSNDIEYEQDGSGYRYKFATIFVID